MTNILNFPEQSRIQEEASQWLVRLDGEPLSATEAEAFSVWLATSRHHTDAIVQLCRLWDNMEILSELSVLFPFDNVTPVKSRWSFADSKRPAYVFAATAIIMLVAITIFLQVRFYPGVDVSAWQEVSYQTAIGEQKDILLEDGSTLNLNTDSHIVVNFSDKERNIRLFRGEVYFKVAHAPERPFLVHTGEGIIRAVGTAFSVRLKGQNMEVTVTEGKVQVAAAATERKDGFDDQTRDKKLAELTMGQTAEFSENKTNSVQTIEPAAVSRKLAWQRGMLEFKGETLEEVVAEISRYTDKKIVIADASIRDIRIGGYFKTGEVDALLAVLKDGFPIVISRVSNDLIYLSDGAAVSDPLK